MLQGSEAMSLEPSLAKTPSLALMYVVNASKNTAADYL
jgi:hypothetical protein